MTWQGRRDELKRKVCEATSLLLPWKVGHCISGASMTLNNAAFSPSDSWGHSTEFVSGPMTLLWHVEDKFLDMAAPDIREGKSIQKVEGSFRLIVTMVRTRESRLFGFIPMRDSEEYTEEVWGKDGPWWDYWHAVLDQFLKEIREYISESEKDKAVRETEKALAKEDKIQKVRDCVGAWIESEGFKA